jgi:hypothetical protein
LLKKIGRLWSVRAGLHHRALAVESEEDIVWFWIGSHALYDRLIGGGNGATVEIGRLLPYPFLPFVGK